MKASLIITLFIVLNVTVSSAEDLRAWTSSTGDSVQAVFVKESAGTITLRTATSNTVKIARTKLSAQDNVYLDNILIKEKTVTVSLRPNRAVRGILVYTEETEENTSTKKFGDIGSRSLGMKGTKSTLEIQQRDTLFFKIKSDLDGKWYDDSKWKVLVAKDLGKTIIGNEQNKDENRKTDGRFILVTFQLTNTGTNEKYIPTPLIWDEKGRNIKAMEDSRYFVPTETLDPYLAKIGAGFSRNYCAIYEVPNDAGKLALKVSTLDKFEFEGTYIPMGDRVIILNVLSKQ
jgi:hypothetical protein